MKRLGFAFFCLLLLAPGLAAARSFTDSGGRAVVLPEHPVIRLKAAPSRLRHLADDGGPVRGLRDEPFRRLAGEAEQNQVLSHDHHPTCKDADLI